MARQEWETLLLEPAGVGDHASHAAWFDGIARRLLCGCRLMVGEVPHRINEIEFYYHGEKHPDLFAHCDPIQKQLARWYFHRTRGVYRGGSFKGFDLTFGGPAAFGGILIRGIEVENGALIDGPSLSVDHLLSTTETTDVATLDEAIEGRPAWDVDCPLRITWLPRLEERSILKTARVGLSLKKHRKSDPPSYFILKPYRYLCEPRLIGKGKLHMVLALHQAGVEPADIRSSTNCTRSAVDRYLADFAEGRGEESFDRYFGLELTPRDLCRLHGLWWSRFGTTPASGAG